MYILPSNEKMCYFREFIGQYVLETSQLNKVQ